MNPKISIITITYNSEKTLEGTILSVLSQNYANFEYIIIDGASSDNTLEIVDKYRDRISVVISEPDHGISDAFNKGIRHATGEIIGIINSDDLLMPGALKTISDNYDSSVDVYSGICLFWNDKTDEIFPCYPEVSFDKLKLQYSVAHPSRFITKRAYEMYGGYVEELKYNMDIELLCRFYKKGAKFMYVDKPLAKFRIGGTTADPIYKKKDDLHYFVLNNGGSERIFKLFWFKAVLKYHLICLGYAIFGDDLKFKISRIGWLHRILNFFLNMFF